MGGIRTSDPQRAYLAGSFSSRPRHLVKTVNLTDKAFNDRSFRACLRYSVDGLEWRRKKWVGCLRFDWMGIVVFFDVFVLYDVVVCV